MSEENRKLSKFDSKVVNYSRWVIKWRWLIILTTFLIAGVSASGGRFLVFDTNYRVFFGDDNPQLADFEQLQNIYTKNDNIIVILEPSDGEVFTGKTLDAVEWLTGEAWKVPYAIRVDAITNFQHIRAEGDELIVEDLVYDALNMSQEQLDYARETAVKDPLLLNRLISSKAHVTGVNITLQLPGESIFEVPESVEYARGLATQLEETYPHIRTYLTGTAMLNNAFTEAGLKDIQTLIPLMYLLIIITMIILLRSFSGTLAALLVIGLSAATAMGLAGWAGIGLTPPSATAPTMILTLAVADSIHILMIFLREMRHGMNKSDALAESLRLNFMPVFLTSVTTVIGFLSLNFSDVPPLHDLGNIASTGIVAAYVYSILFLPAMISVLPFKVKLRDQEKLQFMDRFADFVIKNSKLLLAGSVILIIILASFITRNELNDQFVEYFDESIKFRTDTDFTIDNLTGVYQIEHSLGAGESGGISNPAYLNKLEDFANWYREQDGVIQVYTVSEIMKRLNRSMHGDDEEWYRIPESRELAAQYLLLYEMSLPYGLDLNNQINVDKSATRLTATFDDVTSKEMREMSDKGSAWLRENAPEYMFYPGSGMAVMFSYISGRNIDSMLKGTSFALILISFSLILALRSFKFGLISLIPNIVPALMAFGVWGLLVGEVGFALAIVTSMSLGIVVDDTVHFLSKYLRARREKNLSTEEAIRYAFSSVGTALLVTTLILIAGFAVLSLSSFKVNAGMGQLTAITIAFALLIDFVMLPPVIMLFSKKENN
ncbi:MAG: MMPL family transporter [Candidatus Marinimicrobia bacterium]|nr:MMPL family transporter [Candidatus Neomarinimicrobiota bacterium]